MEGKLKAEMALPLPAWCTKLGPESDIVVSTRARLARNLVDVPFPERADVDALDAVAHKVRLASRSLEARCGKMCVLTLQAMSDDERLELVDAHVASLDQIESGRSRLVILDCSAELAIMVNEEDHLRIQSIVSGLDIERAWRIVDTADDLLGRDLHYAFSDSFGYLTASLTNTGTGLRTSAMLHLAGLSMVGKLSTTLKAVYDLGVSVRGLFGEGTKGLGDFFQVSNETTLGLPESEILNRVKVTAEYLLAQERMARKLLADNERKELREIAGKSIAAAKRCYQITPQDALSMLSPIRLVVALGLAEGCGLETLNELIVKMGAGRPPEFKMDRFRTNEDNTRRASILRHSLSKMKLMTN